MRKRFEQQLSIGQIPIEDTFINPKSKHAIDELLAALKKIYITKEYNERIFSILENHLVFTKQKTGRKGMDLWQIFVLAQVRLNMNMSYETLHNIANNHKGIRGLMGVEREFGYEDIRFEYQNIYDNVSLLNDEIVKELNQVILDFGSKKVFKKKENTASHFKTDSFVLESNVHFPTDYNLLWDSARKSLDTISKIIEKHSHIPGWRKIKNWRYELKGLMRELGKASSSGGKNKQKRMFESADRYIIKSKVLSNKLKSQLPKLPQKDIEDIALALTLEEYISLMDKHIDLVERRIIKGETIAHHEKIFSIFEPYTEWIKKGKLRPNVELGKKLMITTDENNLIVDYQILNNQQDRDVVIDLADRLLPRFKIASWSFDKGYWSKENKALLSLEVPQVIMPKLGKRNKAEESEENARSYKLLKNKHSGIESNINELEHRGLDRCPDRGEDNYNTYTGLAICSYNLKKIGRQILQEERALLKKEKKRLTQAA